MIHSAGDITFSAKEEYTEQQKSVVMEVVNIAGIGQAIRLQRSMNIKKVDIKLNLKNEMYS